MVGGWLRLRSHDLEVHRCALLIVSVLTAQVLPHGPSEDIELSVLLNGMDDSLLGDILHGVALAGAAVGSSSAHAAIGSYPHIISEVHSKHLPEMQLNLTDVEMRHEQLAWEDEQGGQLAADANLAWAAQRVEINMAQEEVQKRQEKQRAFFAQQQAMVEPPVDDFPPLPTSVHPKAVPTVSLGPNSPASSATAASPPQPATSRSVRQRHGVRLMSHDLSCAPALSSVLIRVALMKIRRRWLVATNPNTFGASVPRPGTTIMSLILPMA